jgi:hypothetical protein
MEAGDAAAVNISGDRHPRAVDWLAVQRVRQHQVQRVPGGRCMAMYRLGLGMLLSANPRIERQHFMLHRSKSAVCGING